MMSSVMSCPYCGKEMSYFVRTSTTDMLSCKECKCTFTVKTSWGLTQEALLAAISVLSGVITLIAFLGIHSIRDFLHTHEVQYR